MNLDETGFWNKKKHKLKQRFPAINDMDLTYTEGKEKEMVETLGYKLGKSTYEMIFIIATI